MGLTVATAIVFVVAFATTTTAQLAGNKHVGCYYGVWAYTRPGLGEFWPEDIDVELCDVIYYGFGNVLNGTYEVCSWDPWFDMSMEKDAGEKSIKNCIQDRDGDHWSPGCTTDNGLKYCNYDGIRRTIALKEKNPNLKVLYSVGGWTAGGWIFSDMAQTAERRGMFIQSAIHFMKYFGFDGIDLDWEFPAFDMLPETPTDPADREHFTALMQEMHDAFSIDGYLLTFAAAADPRKAGDAYELDKVHPNVDWMNVMSYDYHGAWDNFTGIDQPLFGKWEEGFIGHPMYQFNMHDTIQYYLQQGVPADKLSLGIHTEGKAWTLAHPATEESCPSKDCTPETCPDCQAFLYCPAGPSPNMTYSRQPGWMFYYEVLQFYYNDTMPDAELPTHWPDLKPGLEHWTIYDQEHGNVDGCYKSPMAYQGQYWISYDDEHSVNLKIRYANHFDLKGAFVWEVDTDNFMGMYGKERYTILSEINRAVLSGDGLSPDELLGHAHENKGKCTPEVPMCDYWDNGLTTPPIPTGTILPMTTTQAGIPCNTDSECNADDSILCDSLYSNCFYCNVDGFCDNGCSDNVNCGALEADSPEFCSGEHTCEVGGAPIVMSITVKTKSCQDCSTDALEQALKLELTGLLGIVTCQTGFLDNSEEHDFSAGGIAIFDEANDGLGACYHVDLSQKVTSGKAMWSGSGTWTPESVDSICVDFYGAGNMDACCSIESPINNSDGWVVMTNCHEVLRK